MWILTWTFSCLLSCDNKYEIIYNADYASERLKSLMEGNEFASDVRLFKVDEEVDIDVAYPDYFGGDDSGQ